MRPMTLNLTKMFKKNINERDGKWGSWWGQYFDGDDGGTDGDNDKHYDGEDDGDTLYLSWNAMVR